MAPCQTNILSLCLASADNNGRFYDKINVICHNLCSKEMKNQVCAINIDAVVFIQSVRVWGQDCVGMGTGTWPAAAPAGGGVRT